MNRELQSAFAEDGRDIKDWLLKHEDDPEYDYIHLYFKDACYWANGEGSIDEFNWTLNLVKQAGEGGDKCAAEFMQKGIHNLRCEAEQQCSELFRGNTRRHLLSAIADVNNFG